jgi:hypothetical protein
LLKEIHVQIKSQEVHRYVTFWIVCCLILHNLIIHIEEGVETRDNYEEWCPPDNKDKDDSEAEGEVSGDYPESSCEEDKEDEVEVEQSFRQKLMAALLASTSHIEN